MLETQYVFVDTEPMRAARFDVERGGLKRLLELVDHQRITVVLPTVTRREYLKKLNESIDAALEALGSLTKKHRTLALAENTPLPAVFEPIDEEAAREAVVARFNRYLDDLNPEEAETPADTLAVVLDLYFTQLAPFNDPRKKKEFPDAIALHSLARWADEEEVSIYVVSRDGDLRSYCETKTNLLHLETLGHLFALVTAEAEMVAALLASTEDEIVADVSSAFEGGGFLLEEEDGEVPGVTVESIQLEEILAQHVDPEEELVLFEVQGTINFQADIHYWDMDHAIWDSEDKVLIPFDRIEKTVRDTYEFRAYGTLSTLSKLTKVDWLDLDVDLPNVVHVSPYAEQVLPGA